MNLQHDSDNYPPLLISVITLPCETEHLSICL